MNESLNIEWTIKTVNYFELDGAMKTGTLTFNTIIQHQKIRSILLNIKRLDSTRMTNDICQMPQQK